MSFLKSSNRILVIDDSEDIHEDFHKVLQPYDDTLKEMKKSLFGEELPESRTPFFEIDSALQGEEGFEMVKKSIENSQPYFLAFVDIRMPPGWDGIETIEKIWSIDSELQTVICTAYSDYSWQEMIKRLGVSDRLLILKKPFDNIEVRQISCALHKKWQLKQQNTFQLDLLQTMVDERTAEIRATLEATADGLIVVSQFSKIIDYNQNFLKLWKELTWENESIYDLIIRREPDDLITFVSSNSHDTKNVRSTFENLFFNFEENNFSDLRFEIQLKNGKIVELYTRPLLLKTEIIGRVLSFRDITEQRYFEQQLTFQATHDLLTGLPNRMLLVDRLQQAIFQAKRSKTQIAILFMDMDSFKTINDSLGHNFGDELLKAVAARLEECQRETDTLCRVGGDEFVLIMPGLGDENTAQATIKRILDALNVPFMINGHQITLTGSLGVSFYPKNGLEADDLLKNADAAMYRAKSLGKNTFQFYAEEMNVRIRERFDLEQNLYLAYKLGELFLHYQPIIDLKTGEIKETEVLLRWHHPEFGMIVPQKFISIAEQTGLILPIGEWVLRSACEQNLLWQKQGCSSVPIAINISRVQLKDHKTISVIENALKEIGYDGKWLILELTEKILPESDIDITQEFKKLQAQGISFCIDDFGTGYSNLSKLMHYPITKLKIDKSFIASLPDNRQAAALTKAMIEMAHNLNLKAIAEGVETEAQYRFLLDIGCDEAQGFFFHPPVDGHAYHTLLKEGQVQVH